MGVWSEPVFAICYDNNKNIIDSKTVMLDFTNLDEDDLIIRLSSHGTIVNGKTTFHESIMDTCNTAKIYGYLTKDELDAWSDYFNLLFEQNEAVDLANAHFYCSDNEFPYIISMHRDDKSVKIYTGQRGNILYSKIETKDGETYISFDKDLYVKNTLEHRKLMKCYITLCDNLM